MTRKSVKLSVLPNGLTLPDSFVIKNAAAISLLPVVVEACARACVGGCACVRRYGCPCKCACARVCVFLFVSRMGEEGGGGLREKQIKRG